MKFLGLFLFFAFTTAAQAAKLDLLLKSDRVILLNTSTRSCQAMYSGRNDVEDVVGPHGVLPQIKLSWSGPSNLIVHYIAISLSSYQIEGQDYTAIIGGDDLLYTWHAAQSNSFTEVELKQNEIQQNGCPAKFGSVGLINKKIDASGTGSILVYGTFKNEAGITEAITASVPLTFEYRGLR